MYPYPLTCLYLVMEVSFQSLFTSFFLLSTYEVLKCKEENALRRYLTQCISSILPDKGSLGFGDNRKEFWSDAPYLQVSNRGLPLENILTLKGETFKYYLMLISLIPCHHNPRTDIVRNCQDSDGVSSHGLWNIVWFIKQASGAKRCFS